jgi:DNA-binding response OmpR family regulator
LPDGDGLAVLRRIRQHKDPLPVLVLTARGACVKPFAFEELLARREALLNRPGQ